MLSWTWPVYCSWSLWLLLYSQILNSQTFRTASGRSLPHRNWHPPQSLRPHHSPAPASHPKACFYPGTWSHLEEWPAWKTPLGWRAPPAGAGADLGRGRSGMSPDGSKTVCSYGCRRASFYAASALGQVQLQLSHHPWGYCLDTVQWTVPGEVACHLAFPGAVAGRQCSRRVLAQEFFNAKV